MRTVTLDFESLPMALKTSCMAGARPIISTSCWAGLAVTESDSRVRSRARPTTSTASSTSKGFGRYSNAPHWREVTALSRSECAVMTMTGSSGSFSLSAAISSRPSAPGMRMSVITTSGVADCRPLMTSSADSNVSTCQPLCDNAFSRTQRMDRSSSTTQMRSVFIVFAPMVCKC